MAETETDIFFRSGERPGARYVSGRCVFDECLADGRLVSRYWNPNGQVWPEMHLQHLRWAVDQPADTFRLCVNGQDLAGGLAWDSAVVEADPSGLRGRPSPDGESVGTVVHGAIRLVHVGTGVAVKIHTWMRMPRGLKILGGVTMSLPPEILLRTFGTEVGKHVLEGDVDTQPRLCLCWIIFHGVAPSLEELTPYLRRRVEHYLHVYKTIIRPAMIDGRMFHHTPFLPLAEATPWCVLEYAKADHSTAVAGVFRTSAAAQDEDVYVLRPRGLDLSRRYEVTLDGQSQHFQATGRELARDGVPVRLEQPQTSELVLLQAADGPT